MFGPGMALAAGGSPKPALADLQRDLWGVGPAALDQTWAVNVRGVYFSIAAFLPLLGAARRGAQVVVVSSIDGFSRAPALHFAYSASKAAVTHMAEQFANRFAEDGIWFNFIAPGCELFSFSFFFSSFLFFFSFFLGECSFGGGGQNHLMWSLQCTLLN